MEFLAIAAIAYLVCLDGIITAKDMKRKLRDM